ncbi:disulfide bond formation protein DsbA [Tersicoccus phoenicis]|uniref:Disulfide bond formation protein DsbA n=1 Tax=Tersicoccus phoenicis TaxID=554083 RepID=A0A1R1LJ78_9MICC|nr:DsbA family oxidoreductase [Tersicoccus phoenicis]OMH27582.1 disulfide bond formation protein DsbA [Tersicoccus phoenicis]
MNIDIWSDIACPWCYIGKRRFESALARFEHRDAVTVSWHSFQLDPALPAHYEGTELEYLSERKGMPADRVAQMFAQVTEVAAGEGLAYDFDALVVANSLSGHQLLHLAAEHGVAADVKESLLSAHFERGLDIGDRQVLVGIGTGAGLDAEEITTALDSGRFRDAVSADIRRAQSLGITGVPFFVLDGKYGISGAQPVELFDQALRTAWTEANPLVMVTPEGNADREADLDGRACGPDGC